MTKTRTKKKNNRKGSIKRARKTASRSPKKAAERMSAGGLFSFFRKKNNKKSLKEPPIKSPHQLLMRSIVEKIKQRTLKDKDLLLENSNFSQSFDFRLENGSPEEEKLDDSDMEYLAPFIEKNKTLSQFFFSGNAFTTVGVQILIDALKSNPTTKKELWITGNFNNKDADTIAEMVSGLLEVNRNFSNVKIPKCSKKLVKKIENQKFFIKNIGETTFIAHLWRPVYT